MLVGWHEFYTLLGTAAAALAALLFVAASIGTGYERRANIRNTWDLTVFFAQRREGGGRLLRVWIASSLRSLQ